MEQSKRDAKRYKHDADDRELRRLHQKYKSIDKAIRNLGWLDLEKPIYLGYVKSFVLRDDISRRKDAKLFEEILKHINHLTTCKNKDFLKKDWKTKKKVPIEHRLLTLSKRVYNKLPSNQQKYFSASYDRKHSRWSHEFIYDYYFVPKVDKHYAYKVRVFDADLERQSAEIERYFETNNLWPRISKLMGWSRNSHWDRTGEILAVKKDKQTALRDVLDEIDQRVYRVNIKNIRIKIRG